MISVKCDTGDRNQWMQAQEIWFPEHGLVPLKDPIDWGYAVSFESPLGLIEIFAGNALLYPGQHRNQETEKHDFN